MSILRTAGGALLAGVLVLTSTGAAVAKSPPASPGTFGPTLEGTGWALQQLAVDATLTEVPSDVAATLYLQDGQASGDAGCNTFSGDYSIDGDALTFGPMMSTMMICEGEKASTEAAYLAGFPLVASYAVEGDTLGLLDASGAPLLTYAALTAQPIAGSWVVTSYNADRNDMAPPITGSLLTAVFGADGTIEGDAGCDQFSGPYTTDGDGVAVDHGLYPGGMRVERAAGPGDPEYLGLLMASNTWSLDGGVLELVDTGGVGRQTTVVFSAANDAAYLGSWEVTGFDDGSGAVVSPVAGPRSPLSSILTGPSRVARAATLSQVRTSAIGTSMTIGPLATTRMACSSPALDTQEQQFLTALQSVAAWEADDRDHAARLGRRDEGRPDGGTERVAANARERTGEAARPPSAQSASAAVVMLRSIDRQAGHAHGRPVSGSAKGGSRGRVQHPSHTCGHGEPFEETHPRVAGTVSVTSPVANAVATHGGAAGDRDGDGSSHRQGCRGHGGPRPIRGADERGQRASDAWWRGQLRGSPVRPASAPARHDRAALARGGLRARLPSQGGLLRVHARAPGVVGHRVIAPRSAGESAPGPRRLRRRPAVRLGLGRGEAGPGNRDWPSGPIDPEALGLSGHSMGGGAPLLAAARDPAIRAVATLAAAESDPSAIDAASRVVAPVLFVAAADDAITPLTEHQRPMFEAKATGPAQLRTIVGASHCGFLDLETALLSLVCDDAAIGPDEQRRVTRAVLAAWLRYELAGDASVAALAWPEAPDDTTLVEVR